jgi:hypothetical protein
MCGNRRFIMTQNERIVEYLSSGRTLTPAQARARFGVRNLRARVNDLRNDGYCVYTNRTGNGVNYRMGSPSREIVAAAYRHVGGSVFVG